MMLQFLSELIGHFHPLVVHLPIGILLVAALLYFLARTEKYQGLRPAVSILLLVGMVSAVLACLTGWLLSTTDDYDTDLVGKHQWLGIATAIVSIACYVAERRNFSSLTILMVILALMISFTGHLGGTITHGDGYLTSAFDTFGADATFPPIANVQEARVFEDVVQPILAARCYNCHGSRKQKGGLRLDEKEFILKGGKDGVVVIPGDAATSELIHRLFLPHDNEDHMPPKEKPQLTNAQKDLIKWWIASGAPFDKKVGELVQPSEIKASLTSLSAGNTSATVPDIPVETVESAPPVVLANLRAQGLAVLPVAANSNYLSVNLINVEPGNDSVTLLLLPLRKQIVWLKTGPYPMNEESLKQVAKLGALTRLQLGNIDSEGLQHLRDLENLVYLNIASVKLSNESVTALKELKKLKSLYLFHCDIPPSLYTELRTALPTVAIDTGGYVVPTLASDTTEITAAKQ